MRWKPPSLQARTATSSRSDYDVPERVLRYAAGRRNAITGWPRGGGFWRDGACSRTHARRLGEARAGRVPPCSSRSAAKPEITLFLKSGGGTRWTHASSWHIDLVRPCSSNGLPPDEPASKKAPPLAARGSERLRPHPRATESSHPRPLDGRTPKRDRLKVVVGRRVSLPGKRTSMAQSAAHRYSFPGEAGHRSVVLTGRN